MLPNKLGFLRAGRELRHPRSVAGPVSHHGPEDAGETAGQCDNRHAVPAGLPDSERPISQVSARRSSMAQKPECSLDQQRPHPRRARLCDGPSLLLVARAALAGDEPKIGLELVGVTKALGIVDGSHERRGGYGADAWDGAQRTDRSLLFGPPRNGLIEGVHLHLQLLEHDEQRFQLVMDTREQACGTDALTNCSDSPPTIRIPCLESSALQTTIIRVRVRTRVSRTVSCDRTIRCSDEVLCAAR